VKLFWIVSAVTIAAVDRPAVAVQPPVAVAIQGFGFKPKLLEVEVDTRVVWTNADEIDHTVTAVADSGVKPRFDGDLPGQGKTFSFTFESPGTFVYQCARHTFMRGEIRVTPKGEH